jgi:mono/diheme cytochrome c family protein
MRIVAGGLGVVAILLAGIGLRVGMAGAQQPVNASKPEFYATKVLPIFKANCYACHGNGNHKGGLSLETKAGIMKGGLDGVVVVPGSPQTSLLVRLIRHEGPGEDPPPMPLKGAKLSGTDIAVIEQWVKAGAVMPAE